VKDVDIECRALDVDSFRLDQLQRLLSQDERERAARFRFEKHARHFIAARGILREILGPYLAVDPALIRFDYNSFGKPSVEGGPRFNVSHSGGFGLYAVSGIREVGVDIERINPDFAHERIPERFFAPGEVAALRALPADAQIEAFFHCWTRKEAYIKAHGSGLSLDLKSFEVTLTPGEPARFLRGVEGWSIETIEVPPGYVAALVAATVE
jgi:4'-phosphopantetheinyl transferase